jgi:hypothetical protein
MKRFIAVAAISVMLSLSARAQEAVPDAHAAEKIAADTMKARLGEEGYAKLMQYSHWDVELQGDDWVASPMIDYTYELPCDDRPNDPNVRCILVQAGGLVVRISRHDGRVLDIHNER